MKTAQTRELKEGFLKVTSELIIEVRERIVPEEGKVKEIFQPREEHIKKKQPQPHTLKPIELNQLSKIFEKGETVRKVIEKLNPLCI